MGSWVSERCLRMNWKSFSQVDDYFCHMLTELYQNGPDSWAYINCSFNLDWGFSLRKPFPGRNYSIYWFFFPFCIFPWEMKACRRKGFIIQHVDWSFQFFELKDRLISHLPKVIVLFQTQSNSPILHNIMFFKYSLVMVFHHKVKPWTLTAWTRCK